MDGKHCPLQNGIGRHTPVIRNVKFFDLCLFGTVFQGIGILSLRLRRSLSSIFGCAIRLFRSGSLQILII